MNTFHSEDGTTLGYDSMGQGPSVVVIPGALSVAADYAEFARALAEHGFAVHVLERRGRGVSGPQGAGYGIEQEREDALTLVRATSARFLVGHSFGGLIALEAARKNPGLEKIALYEPGVSVDGSIGVSWAPRYEQLLVQGRRLDAFAEFSIAAGPERARHWPHWLMKALLLIAIPRGRRRQMLALLPENLREHREVARLDNTYEHYREVVAGALLMCGGKTDARWVDLAIARLAQTLPNAETRRFERMDHFGIDRGAPREVAAAVGAHFQR